MYMGLLGVPRKPPVLCLHCSTILVTIRGHRKQVKYCSSRCQTDYNQKNYIDRWKVGDESGLLADNTLSNYIRRYLIQKHNYRCQECGWNKINPKTGRCPLEVDHVDSNWANNLEENLKVLCPNCHALTPGWKSLNRGYGRKQKRISTGVTSIG